MSKGQFRTADGGRWALCDVGRRSPFDSAVSSCWLVGGDLLKPALFSCCSNGCIATAFWGFAARGQKVPCSQMSNPGRLCLPWPRDSSERRDSATTPCFSVDAEPWSCVSVHALHLPLPGMLIGFRRGPGSWSMLGFSGRALRFSCGVPVRCGYRWAAHRWFFLTTH